MTPEEDLNSMACDLILESFTALAGDGPRLRERLAEEADPWGSYSDGDEERLAKKIKEGREMFHEIWSMGS